jgi:replicative DNA helicase
MPIEKFVLPHNLIAEKAVLAIIVKYSNSINLISQELPIQAFYLKTHQIIYRTALILSANQKIVDLINLITWLQDNNLIQEIGGLKTLIQLSKKVVNFVNLKEYTELIKEKYIRRLLIEFGKDIIKLSYQTNLSNKIIFNKIQKKIYNLNQKEKFNNFNTTSEILKDIFCNLNQIETNSSFSGYLSQFLDLNAVIEGFQKSDLIIIAGRPSIGKTAFSLNLAYHICSKYNQPVIYFSLEMTKVQLVYRLLSIETEITISQLKSGNLVKDEWFKINNAVKTLSSLKFFIDDTFNVSLTEIYSKMQKTKFQFGSIGLIVIDYIQLLKTIKGYENRVQEISQITRSLKGFAKEFDVPIIALSQLSRNVESRTNKRPILSDLRESGCINIKRKEFLKYKNNKKFFNIFSLEKYQVKSYPYFNCQFTGFKPVFQIQTKFSLSVLTSFNHKFLNYKFWLNLFNLSNNFLVKINLSTFFKKIFYMTILNEKIKKVKYLKINNVYDFRILKSKNFLKNGFLLHNSIEQDSDIVLMLYRDEYYNQQTKDKNIVEIIISKHRNGPTGIVKLSFDNSLTKFFNYI